MALIDCPECGQEISDQAVSCPNCGYPVNSKSERNQKEKSTGKETSGCVAQLFFFGGLIWILFTGWVALDVYTTYHAQMGTEQNIKMLIFFLIGIGITWEGTVLMGWFKSPF